MYIRLHLRTVLALSALLLTLAIVLSWGSPMASIADANAPQYNSSISPTVAYPSTYRVTLSLTNLLGSNPPSARWYGPDGDQVSAGCKSGSQVREYEYIYGSLVSVKDYFYVSGCNREEGTYRVLVGADVDRTFLLKFPKYYSYLPVVVRPYTEPEPPGAFGKTSPADGATYQALLLSLNWGDSSLAESYAYCYDSSDDDACSGWTDVATATTAPLSGLSADTTYYWQVRATNPKGTTYADGDSASFWSFTTGSGIVAPSDMVQIAAGDFEMGCDPDHNGGYPCYDSRLPLHTVTLDGYYIDETEVTNAQYAACVAAGECGTPTDTSSWSRETYFGNPTYDDYPVLWVTWQDAVDYCAWLGKRLPTEAEWERAAKGTSLRAWPWGDTEPTCDLANFSASYSNQCVGDTDEVGVRPDGASPDGVLDMAGNVQEWVHDWYDKDYYETSPATNPQGPASGEDHVTRGGGYGNMAQDILSAGRNYNSSSWGNLGFRCAADTAP